MKKKILFTASTYAHIVNFHLPYLRFFHDRGWLVHAACGGPRIPVPWTDRQFDVPFRKSVVSPANLCAAGILRETVRREEYALVSVHTSLAAFFTRLALSGMKDRPPVANMVHGYLFDERTPWLKRTLLLAAEQRTAPVTDLLMAMNQWDFETARRCRLGARVVKIPGVGIDPSRLTPPPCFSRADFRRARGIPPQAFVLLYAAEFSRRKSQSVLIRMMPRLPERAVLVLAGSGALRGKCEALARRLGVSGRVIFPGHVSDMAAWYAASDAAVSASRSEGLPFHVLEAMYAGLPVAASDVKGSRDLIEDGRSGLLYPYGSGAACAERVLRLMESEALRRRLARQAGADALRYDIARVLPAVAEQYETLLQGTGFAGK